MAQNRKIVRMVFGEHGDEFTPPNSRFFRSASKPFLADQLSNRRPTIVLLEAQVPVDPEFIVGKSDDQLRDLAHVAVEPFGDFRLQVVQTINDSLSKGELPKAELFGLGKDILRCNRTHKGQVQVAFEPSSEETLYLDWKRYLLQLPSSKDPDKFYEFIRVVVELSFARDRLLIDEISTLSDTGASILSIRGFGHSGMVRMFDPDKFSVESAIQPHAPQFLFDAITERYDGPVSDHRLHLYATLQLSMDVYYGEHADLFMSEGKTRNLINRARKYAIEHNKAAVEELGIIK
ncbi:MAG: hypothetical protein ACP5N9_05195 [Candidatus Bilamarchaeum sp.]